MVNFKTYYRKGNKEKKTYSTFIPDERGFWILGNDSETDTNFSKIGVTEAVKNYMLKDSFSLENMSEIMTNAYKKVNYEKIRMNRDFENNFSLSGITIKNDELICGNIGNTSFRIYRDEKCIEEIKGEKIKAINIEKKDFLILGNEEFWNVVDKNGYNIAKNLKYGSSFMENLRKIIEYEEQKNNKEIVFFIVYIEDLEMNDTLENRKGNKFLYLLIYLMLFLVGVSFGRLTSVDKNVEKMEVKAIESIDNKEFKKRDINLEYKKESNKYSNNLLNIENESKIKFDENKKSKVNKIKFVKKESRILTLDEEIKRNWKLLGRDENGDILTE